MRQCAVRTPEEALAYITDCTLATVAHMSMLKSKKKGEFTRQISIAQAAVDWMLLMKVDMSGTRAEDVVSGYDGNVRRWAEENFILVETK